jgi:hypothetical protein
MLKLQPTPFKGKRTMLIEEAAESLRKHLNHDTPLGEEGVFKVRIVGYTPLGEEGVFKVRIVGGTLMVDVVIYRVKDVTALNGQWEGYPVSVGRKSCW